MLGTFVQGALFHFGFNQFGIAEILMQIIWDALPADVSLQLTPFVSYYNAAEQWVPITYTFQLAVLYVEFWITFVATRTALKLVPTIW